MGLLDTDTTGDELEDKTDESVYRIDCVSPGV
jgi:hypothetical protein